MRVNVKFYLLLSAAVFSLGACSATDGRSAEAAPAKKKSVWSWIQEKNAQNQDNQTASAADGQAEEDINFRMLNLERQMADLKNDISKMAYVPAKKAKPAQKQADKKEADTSISAIEARQKLVAQKHLAEYGMIETAQSGVPAGKETRIIELDAEDPSAATPPLAIAPPPPSSAPVVKTAAPSSVSLSAIEPAAASASVTGVRVGQQANAARLVLDTSEPVKFSYSVDNDRKVLVIRIPEASWSAEAEKSLQNPLIKGYTVQKSAAGGGAEIAVKLAAPSHVKMSTSMKPSGPYGDRIVLDISAL